MKKILYCTIVCILLLTALINITFAGTRRVASADRISSSDWTYDAMISLSSDGLVPGMSSRVFQGDRIFNRLEMAKSVASVIDYVDVDALSSTHRSLINKLVEEFRPELAASSNEALNKWDSIPKETSAPMITGYAQIRSLHDANGNDSVNIPFRVTGIADLNNHIFAAGTIADKNARFFYKMRESSIPDKLFIKGYDKNFTWTVGSEYMNWGPSYAGSMILADTSKSFLQLNGVNEIDLGKWFGRIKITQFASTFGEDGQTMYLFGRRYEKNLTKRLYLGLSETSKSDELPNPLMAVMPFYLYQHLFDINMNILGSLDLLYQCKGGTEIYTEFMVDDMSASKIFQLGRNDWKRKSGYTIGTYFPKAFGGEKLSTFRAEYISVDPQTYGPVSGTIKLPYTHGSLLIGHPLGPNVNALYLRSEQYLAPKLSLITEYLNQKQKKDIEPFRESSSIISAQISYDFMTDTSLSVRIAPTRTKAPGQDSDNETEYELRLSKSF